MKKKVIAADIVCTTRKGTATVVRRVEPQVLAADSGHHIGAHLLLEGPAIDRIEVINNGSIGLGEKCAAIGKPVNRLPCAPGDFAPKTDVMFQQKNSAKAGIESPAQRWKCTGRVGSGTRRYESAKAKRAMELLAKGP